MREVFIPIDLPEGALIAPSSASQLVELSGKTMGTTWCFQGFAPAGVSCRQIEHALHSVFDAAVADFSNWDETSFVSRFNRAEAGSHHHLPASVAHVLREAFRLSSLTGGAFDPCLGAYAKNLTFLDPVRAQEPPVPLSDVSREFCLASSWSRVRINGRVIEKQAGIELDLSAIAKGYAVDQMAEILASLGLNSFLVEIGGEFVGRGVKPDGQPWWVALPPAGQSAAAPVLALCGLALASSGVGERVYRDNGSTSHHIVGQGAAHLSSVSVIADSCMATDGWATALFALGLEAGLACAARHDVAALFLPHKGAPQPTPRLASFLS